MSECAAGIASCYEGFLAKAFSARETEECLRPPVLLRERTPTRITPDDVLNVWLGEKPYEFRSILWIKGLNPNDPKRKIGEDIANRFAPWIRSWGADPHGGEVPIDWQANSAGRVALVILFGCFPRLAFEGTAEMFAYSKLAQKFAAASLADGEELPWSFELFCYVAAVQVEDLAIAIAGSAGIVKLSEKLKAHENGKPSGIGNGIHRYFYQAVAKPAVALLRNFGRDPQRNFLLDRACTAEERNWLKTKKELPSWARLPEKPSMLQKVLSRTLSGHLASDPVQQPKLRILVLHGRPQSGKSFEKLTKRAFGPLREVADLVFADAPHISSDLAGGREWWDAVPDSAGGMKYVGLDASLSHLADVAGSEGSFDGVLGFSQGGCLAGILAALPAEQSVLLNLRFVIVISGFYCRDNLLCNLHVQKQPDEHAPSLDVEPKLASIQVPSFHIRGTGDTKVEAWRSHVLRDCFVGAEEATHPSGHLAPDQWPISSLAGWLKQFPASSLVTGVGPSKLLGNMNAESPFKSRCEALRRLPRLPTQVDDAIGIPDSPSTLFLFPGVKSMAMWARICQLGPILKPNGVRASEMYRIVNDAVAANGLSVIPDMFLLAWHLYPFPGLKSAHRHDHHNHQDWGEPRQWEPDGGKAFFWLFQAAWALAPELLREEQLWHLATFGGWADLLQLAKFTSTAEELGWAAEAQTNTEVAEAFFSDVAEVFAFQLNEDNTRAAKVIAEVSEDDSKQDSGARQIQRILDANTGRYTLPSQCVKSAPRFKTQVQRVSDLALRTAARLHELRFGVTVTDREKFRARLDNEYRAVLSRVTHCLDLHSGKRLHELQVQEKEIWSKAFVSAEEFERMRATPISDAILNPVPEPVEIAPEAELKPLYEFLRGDAKLQPNALGDMTFDRGTLTTDRRLDLCKQVIGPQGVTGLFDALAKDRQSQRHVQHLLLGNNICGQELPAKVAEYIRAGNSQLTTWYIAGNRLTGADVEPLCDALETDCQVRQLWLKRNPLRPDGANQIARVLQTNMYLQVLDVSYCGLLDAGAEAIVQALGSNRTLRNIYLDANGLSEAIATPLAKFLKDEDVRLQTLSIGLNRLYDNGAQVLGSALSSNKSLLKVCLASCGIGSSGIQAIANALGYNCSIVELDVGFLKATAATGEVPNRAEDSGCCALASALLQNTTLRSLKLNHNGVGTQGYQALRDMLCNDPSNSSLVSLEYEQRGLPRPMQLLREEIAGALLRNWAGLEDSQQSQVMATLRSHHLAEIASVYRLGNVYSPGLPVEDAS